MVSDLSNINMTFHEYARQYKTGEIVFLIDGSEAMQKAYPGSAATDIAIDAAAVVKEKLNQETRAFFYGAAPAEIDLDAAAPTPAGGKDTALVPLLKQLRAAYPETSPDKPLHIILVTSGSSSDRAPDLREALKGWLDEPGRQLLLDVIFTTRNHNEMARVIGPVGATMMSGGKSTDSAKPAPNFHVAYTPEALVQEIGEAINSRTKPDDPRAFMAALVNEVFENGVCAGLECPMPATFKSRNP